MSMQQLTNAELETLREDLARKLWQAYREIARRGGCGHMSYFKKSKEEQDAIIKELFSVLGAFDDGDPLCQDPLLAAKSMKAELRSLSYKYRMLLIEHASAMGIAGAYLMREALTACDQATMDGLQRDIRSFAEVAAQRLARVQQLQEAERLHAECDAAFERMIAARKKFELFGGAPEDILRSAGCDKTVRQYGRSIPADELIRACTIEREIPRAAGYEDKGKD